MSGIWTGKSPIIVTHIYAEAKSLKAAHQCGDVVMFVMKFKGHLNYSVRPSEIFVRGEQSELPVFDVDFKKTYLIDCIP